MQRSTTQVLYRYLPNAVFSHDDGFYAQVTHIGGSRPPNINRMVLLDQLGEELSRWQPDQIGIPNPRTNPDEYVILKPEEVVWDVYPLTFECTNARCGRIRRWWRQDTLIADTNATNQLRCLHCSSALRQLRYLAAHQCGAMDPLHTPRCPNCQDAAHMYLEDLGSFRSSSWRCRTCGSAQSTRFTPCDCGLYARGGGQPYKQGYTARDQRLWYPQTLTILNISHQTYDNLQRHADRGVAALASWLGDQPSLAGSLTDLDRPPTNTRMSAEQWADTETRMRASGLDEQTIDSVRSLQGPVTTGVTAIAAGVSAEVIAMANELPMVERAGLFDRNVIEDRRSFADVMAAASGTAAVAGVSATSDVMTALGIEDISVTQRFPIVVASYGYTRAVREPGQAHLRSYAAARKYDSRTPIFTVPANTEALLVTFDAPAILGFLQHAGLWSGPVPVAVRDAKVILAELLAADLSVGGVGPSGVARRLVHSASHALLRALDDGQSGFGESSLAEWIVPNALTSAIYVASYNEFTLGALDSVQRRRIAPWLHRAAEDIDHCDNDPLCSQVSTHRPHAACDRCLHLSFGCRTWNADLDRRLLRRFWLWTRQRAAGA
ncbi:Uncharacterised protein [Mycobacteroides abscessus subsp. bolletii]|uniref:Uncharacterized protein n=1 Tax=Mycobacteroides abscessus subsp. bolletii TaxID=319705 RepID=A0A9Q7SD71_9MYCO|nr:hypothetical protein [Mycobacteroides abscessus]SHU25876.1 Uncharacterised protein [Mycobacteroides abscessus subsp. bolletii]SHV22026.1 Uncharacterised protein [Mycobacteroides abscessus subsp. bolletii]SHX21032.1 Uncharacterised protein [Mycobacteroides abscessus subsp. bolletii]SKL38040.1 Uncharacterised protein [Mycobacteroides abscessus subsp. bolletii]SKM62898.1 Uncharacterised protein [Mycobacteroides abscessus subsp. bolletii]